MDDIFAPSWMSGVCSRPAMVDLGPGCPWGPGLCLWGHQQSDESKREPRSPGQPGSGHRLADAIWYLSPGPPPSSHCWHCVPNLVYTLPKLTVAPQRPTGPSVSQNSPSLMQPWFQTAPLPCYSNTKRHKFRIWVLFYNKNILLQFFFS